MLEFNETGIPILGMYGISTALSSIHNSQRLQWRGLKLRHLGIEVYGECDIIGVDIHTMQGEWNPICLAWDSCKQKWHWQ